MMDQNITPEDLRRIFSTPAVVVNKFFLSGTALGLRLTLAEVQNESAPSMIRGAMMIDFETARNLAGAIQQLLLMLQETPGDRVN